MAKFDLKKITAVKGKVPFYQLTVDDEPDFSRAKNEVERNELKHGVLDEYEEQLEEKYHRNLVQIYNTMNGVSNNQHVPGVKYHELSRPKNDHYKDYEFKSGDLRVYAFKGNDGKIIALGGYKNQQKGDITKMRSLKYQYFDSLNQKK